MSLLCNDIMRFSVLGFRSDLRIELQAPVIYVVPLSANAPTVLHNSL